VHEPQQLSTFLESPEDLARQDAYCIRDCDCEHELHQVLRRLSPRERVIWEVDQAINERGIAVDTTLATAAHKLAIEILADLELRFSTITGLRPTQVEKFRAWCNRWGANLKSVDKASVAAALKRDDLPSILKDALKLRAEAGSASVRKFATLLRSTVDGRLYNQLRYHGSSTGRWSSHGLQVHNLKRTDDDFPVAEALAAIATGSREKLAHLGYPPLEALGQSIRGLFVAAPGCRLMGADFAQIEQVVLAWIAGDTALLDHYRAFHAGLTPFDAYTLTASKIHACPPQDVSKAMRQRGKIADLACGFGGGANALIAMGRNYGLNLTEEQAWPIVRSWREAHPKEVAFWYRLQGAAFRAVANYGEEVGCGPVTFKRDGAYLLCRLPSSRKLHYPFPEIHAVNDEPRVTFMDASMGKWVRNYRVWHGTWVENVVQAVARDLLSECLVRLARTNYPVVLHVHDECLVECPIGFGSLQEFRGIVATVPRWAEGLPVACDAWEGERYR
jgi:DNA polymerase